MWCETCMSRSNGHCCKQCRAELTAAGWERDAFRTFIGVPWNPRGLVVEAPMASSRRRYITKAVNQQHGCSACLGIASREVRAADQPECH